MKPQESLMMHLTVIEFRDLATAKPETQFAKRTGVEPSAVPVIEALLPRQEQQPMVQSMPSAWAQILHAGA